MSVGRPVVTTHDAAAAWRSSLPVASKTLARLANTGLITKIRHGVWHVGTGRPDPAAVLPVLTDPYPSYISGWSALSRHGMIEQIPRDIFAASLDKAKTIDTAFDRYEIHHLHPELFGGFVGGDGLRSGVATPAKALFDTVYLLSTRSGQVTLPELELPEGFDHEELDHWIDAVPSARLRTLTARNLSHLVTAAALHAGQEPTSNRPDSALPGGRGTPHSISR
ncbi:MAG: hypothetical protein JJU45_14875 [Acidimicrobiia bacterium]|nr:hypothetical protein [Acidimicrobiia bacterium]